MLWEVEEHELSDFGVQRAHLEISPGCTEAEFYAKCIDYGKTIAENCQYDPEFSMKIDQLCANYTLDELQMMKSSFAGELACAQNELLTFLSVNSDNLSQEKLEQFADCLDQVEDTIACNEMLAAAIEQEKNEGDDHE